MQEYEDTETGGRERAGSTDLLTGHIVRGHEVARNRPPLRSSQVKNKDVRI